jgi:large subunit ribosomal protein L6
MSRIGKQPIKIPETVKIELKDNLVIVNGPKASLEQKIRPEIKVEKKEDQLLVSTKGTGKAAKSLHGVSRTLIANMIEGVTNGFEKTLELHGVGYRVAPEGQGLKISVGFSHPVVVEPIEGIKFSVEANNLIKVSGADKQLVGQTAAQIRDIRRPEPYKGKGIRYQGETIKLKPGKAAKAGAAEA